MQLFDVGGEIVLKLKFRFREIEASRGEDAKEAIEKKIQEFFCPKARLTELAEASVGFERLWFEPSPPENKATSGTK